MYKNQFEAYNLIQNQVSLKLEHCLKDLTAEKSLFDLKTKDLLIYENNPDLPFNEDFRWTIPNSMCLSLSQTPQITFILSKK
jgi:hypothetical protein